MQAKIQKNPRAIERTLWRIDPDYTTVEFSVTTFLFFTVRGRLAALNGNIVLDENNLSASSVEARFKSDSVDTGKERRDAYFRSVSFFDANQYPEIHFESSRVERGTDRDALVVDGALKLRGHHQTVRFNVDQIDRSLSPDGVEVIYYVATTEIDRSAFGIPGGRRLIGRNVKAWINVQANRRIE